MIRMLIAITMLLTSPSSFQDDNFWNVLAEVSFEKHKDKQGFDLDTPVFSNYLKKYNGKNIQLKGYMVPLQELAGQRTVMLSSLPYSLCYFCGGGGPETVVEVEFAKEEKFVTRRIVIEGTLVLNANNPEHHIYILKSAKLID